MRKILLLGTSISVALGMSGCVTTTVNVQSIPANDAVTHGLAQLYQQPNYQVHSTLQLTQLNFSNLMKGSNPVSDSLNGTTASEQKAANAKNLEVEKFAGWFETIFKRNEFSFDGVVDLQHQRLEITPQITYKAMNTGGFIRVPMMLDLANSQGYADLSAFSPLLVNLNSEGKYSQFSIQPLTDRIDFKKLFTWSHDVALDSSRKFDPRMFRDLPLDQADTALGGVRKIELSLTYQDLSTVNKTVFDAHRADFLAAIKSKPKQINSTSTQTKDKKEAAMDGFIEGVTAMGTVYGQPNSTPMPFNINGKLRKVYLLDRVGRLIQNRVEGVVDVDTKSSRTVTIGFNSITSYSQYGSARINFIPTAQNTVSLSESTKGTVIDIVKGAAEKYKQRAENAAAASKTPITK
ncbi:MAG: hypothetical protein H7Z73_08145 [Candidatus Saccharibacteria bacterium]|nr:hypothetical protein [Moraxellaceae bacterium]